MLYEDITCGPHLPAAAPRHLLHRGLGPADPRSEERQPGRLHLREAGVRGGRGDSGRRGFQGQGRSRGDRRSRWRHRGSYNFV